MNPLTVSTVPNAKTLTVEVWSDFMCPYCYMGKRMLRSAIASFPYRHEVEIVWRSFQLMPELQTDTRMDIYALLAQKGFDRRSAIQAHEQLAHKGLAQGIAFHFDKIVVANTFNAHRLMHYAEACGKQDEAQEKLFSAYFTEGKNLDDHGALVALGEEIGLDGAALSQALLSDAYADSVLADRDEAAQREICFVPHFSFGPEHAVTGAEGAELLLKTLGEAFEAAKRTSSEA